MADAIQVVTTGTALEMLGFPQGDTTLQLAIRVHHAQGRTNPEIARALGKSQSYVRATLQRLGLSANPCIGPPNRIQRNAADAAFTSGRIEGIRLCVQEMRARGWGRAAAALERKLPGARRRRKVPASAPNHSAVAARKEGGPAPESSPSTFSSPGIDPP